ncbi:MAG: hypothetical protein IGS49_09630 [Chlorogloeopsis fritschii C42_A2020_084]|uniref:hypothetical protein n=1 Tax=Chlorogloeopsis fritschii TaxID=1124 RepID=UPI0019FD9A95|nr:hypothetical protein [Chlorogloeopsis fritschii]MBF2005707.1 hypothetical protein [Chlorogloeopsis fritschii C42_A2020_084]
MKKRKKTKVELLIEVLQDGAWHLGDELAIKVGDRFGDAVKKARTLGYKIETDWVGVGQQHKYRLLIV